VGAQMRPGVPKKGPWGPQECPGAARSAHGVPVGAHECQGVAKGAPRCPGIPSDTQDARTSDQLCPGGRSCWHRPEAAQ